MAWMFRWLSGLLSRLRANDSAAASSAWVEPSNAITRAILSGAVAELPPLVGEAAPAEVLPLAAKPAAPATTIVTKTAQRVRRRRAGRAA